MTIDKSLFRVNEQTGKFDAVFSVTGTIRREIQASTLDEAKEKARAMCADEEFGLEIDETEEVAVDFVSPAPIMYLVTRNGRKMQVSRLDEGDEPREPDERGF